jgi:hypothetical protein
MLSVCRHAPLLASHILTILSLDADAGLLESGEKAIEMKSSLWHSRVCKHAPQPTLIFGLTVIPCGSSY